MAKQLGHGRAKVAWSDCYAKLKYGGLNLIGPKAATRGILVKWVIMAFEGGKSKIHVLIQYRLENAQPDRKSKWGKGMGWMFLNHHLPIERSKIRKRIGEAWKSMLKHVVIMPPKGKDPVLNTNIWWQPEIQGIQYGFLGNRVAQFDRNGLNYIWNIWDFENNQLHQPLEIVRKLELDHRVIKAIETMTNSI